MTMMKRPKALLFDVDGTLYRQTPLRAFMAAELLTLPLHGPLKTRRRLAALKAYRRAQEQLRHAPGARAGDQLVLAATASGLPLKEVERLVADWIMRRPLKYLAACRARGLTELLDLATRQQTKLGVLTDYPAEDKLAALGLAGRFSPVLSAADPEIDAFKPSPRGFLRACEVWSLEPADVLFVGDRPEVDAAGATAAGMPCVIMGSAKPGLQGLNYSVVRSFERLGRVFDGS